MKPKEKLIRYEPKGGMCAGCVHKHEDCSHLDFESMPVVSTYESVEDFHVRVVACKSYKKRVSL